MNIRIYKVILRLVRVQIISLMVGYFRIHVHDCTLILFIIIKCKLY